MGCQFSLASSRRPDLGLCSSQKVDRVLTLNFPLFPFSTISHIFNKPSFHLTSINIHLALAQSPSLSSPLNSSSHLPFHSTDIPTNSAEAPTTTLTDVLKIAQMAQVNESQIVKLAKAISSMIQHAIKKAMKPYRDKLRGLYSTVEVLENEVIALRNDVATLTGPPPASNPTPPEPAGVTS
ncbi:hypothetical protein HAX54_021952 [Datura stramonium]|uniref:Uncharacterized protein n=1 Tax=Datura stramonium TaxID=4076 RepID=A0ABS8UVW3_DATST|nr:hypothetical protein [Datura stramonium]